jgi:hypothetical protein
VPTCLNKSNDQELVSFMEGIIPITTARVYLSDIKKLVQ